MGRRATASERDILDAVVVGAGWAGLGVSQALAQRGLRHKVFERGRIGETWLTQRWDSFRINTANIHTVMPGQTYAGPDPNGAMTAAEFVELLEDYVQQFDLPVETNTPVTRLAEEDGLYRLSIPNGQAWARNVVIASSNQNCPVRPAMSSQLPPHNRLSSAWKPTAYLFAFDISALEFHDISELKSNSECCNRIRQEYRSIVQAIEERDSVSARQAMRVHLENRLDRLRA